MPKMMAKYPTSESIGSIVSIVVGILEVREELCSELTNAPCVRHLDKSPTAAFDFRPANLLGPTSRTGSSYPLLEVSGSENHTLWNQKSRIIGI